jgi:hypothetical protein
LRIEQSGESHSREPLLELLIVVQAVPLRRDGQVDECGVARLQRLVEMREGGVKIAYRSGQSASCTARAPKSSRTPDACSSM